MAQEWRRSCEANTAEARNDLRSTDELINIALTEPDEHAAWDAVHLLHYRATEDVFAAARRLCASDCPQEKTLGANILGQLGIPVRRFPGESVAILLKLLEIEEDAGVIGAICVALGHIHDPTAIKALSRFKTHPSFDVRYGVVLGLLCFAEDLAIETLIELSRDEDNVVRDWATFGLGTMIDADTPPIRQALFVRVFDTDEVTRGEALVGLARRKDPRIIEPLIKELSGYANAEYTYSLEAAGELADPRLLPVLQGLKETHIDEEAFDEAIRRCSHTEST